MPIQTVCQHCSKAYTLADAMKGKSVKCKNCAQIFLVGGAAKAPGAVQGHHHSTGQDRPQTAHAGSRRSLARR